MQEIDLQLDTENELVFKVTVEGTSPADPKCRLVIENSSISYMFDGNMDRSGEVSVVIPSLEKIIREGIYDANLEVIVEDRVFIPLSVNINFEKSMSVTAEAVNRKRKPTVVARAELLTGTEKRSHESPVRVAERNEKRSDTKEVIPRRQPRNVDEEQIRKKSQSQLKSADIKNLSENQIRDLIKKVFLK
tara:strand:+ start:1271 stop:1840 length:570 start_codon:yes stop_codon:yes gene_type:complete